MGFLGPGIAVAVKIANENFDFSTAVFSARQPPRYDGCVVDNQHVSRSQEMVQHIEAMMKQFIGLAIHYQKVGLIPAVNRFLGDQFRRKLVFIIG
jgi:hypothetical protein